MPDLNLQFKPASSMRICLTGEECGVIVEGNFKYCQRCIEKRIECQRKNHQATAKAKPRFFPKWTCCDCSGTIQLTFYPTKNSYNHTKFEKLKEHHICIPKKSIGLKTQ